MENKQNPLITFFIRHKKDENNNCNEIAFEIDMLNEKLNAIHHAFNNVSNEDLIEALIYEEKGLQARYSYLLKKAREEKVKIQLHERK